MKIPGVPDAPGITPGDVQRAKLAAQYREAWKPDYTRRVAPTPTPAPKEESNGVWFRWRGMKAGSSRRTLKRRSTRRLLRLLSRRSRTVRKVRA